MALKQGSSYWNRIVTFKINKQPKPSSDKNSHPRSVSWFQHVTCCHTQTTSRHAHCCQQQPHTKSDTGQTREISQVEILCAPVTDVTKEVSLKFAEFAYIKANEEHNRTQESGRSYENIHLYF